MPELPEVETIRRQLAPVVEGRRLAEMEVLDPRWCEPAPPWELADAVRGRRIERLDRRGKYLIWELSREVYLVVHLRMTGNLLYTNDARFARVRMRLDDGGSVVFADQRRFGTGVVLLGTEARDDYFASRLGVEPLGADFTADHIRELARGRRAPAKAFLLNQERIAGVGNIYADEALFIARIHPLRPIGTLRRKQFEELRAAVVEVLEAGIDARGATIDDFRHADGVQGAFQDEFLVHLRRGEPCPRCGTPVVKFAAAGRGTYACEHCQRRPRARRPAR
jgi:formamidopyrimidine-DNA glycosylase